MVVANALRLKGTQVRRDTPWISNFRLHPFWRPPNDGLLLSDTDCARPRPYGARGLHVVAQKRAVRRPRRRGRADLHEETDAPIRRALTPDESSPQRRKPRRQGQVRAGSSEDGPAPTRANVGSWTRQRRSRECRDALVSHIHVSQPDRSRSRRFAFCAGRAFIA